MKEQRAGGRRVSRKGKDSPEWRKREGLREKGQFWTPAWVAEAMVAYVAQGGGEVFDPGVGKGAFYVALRKQDESQKFLGADLDAEILAEARGEGIFGEDANLRLEVRDFITNPSVGPFAGIVANPPYMRHHRLGAEMKQVLGQISQEVLGEKLDGRAGLHVYFLVQALRMLERGGRLAFIMPADTAEGVFAKKLWDWIAGNFRIDGVITFDHAATPFSDIDTNACIFLIKNEAPKATLKWAKCRRAGNAALKEFLGNDLREGDYEDMEVVERDLQEALRGGLSREARTDKDFEFTLHNFARVVRGVATGANEFFFLTREEAKRLGLPSKFLLRAVGRTRDVKGSYLTEAMLEELDLKGRPTLLFAPDGMSKERLPERVRYYIESGEAEGLNKRALLSTRRPWYKMESREVPPFLFAYLGRRSARFIKNEAEVVPLTGFLCVYPHSTDEDEREKLWKVLQDESTVGNLRLVGKSYGSGAIKVEPRALERLPLSTRLVKEMGLKPRRN